MTVAELMSRARSSIGHGAVYQMGGGVFRASSPTPLDEEGTADCSSWVCWALGVNKYEHGRGTPDKWWGTDAMWVEAVTTHGPERYFERIPMPEVGCIVVYPALSTARHYWSLPWPKGLPAVGHVGLVSDVHEGVIMKIIHCSSGNYRRSSPGDAIAETGPDVFRHHPATTYAWSKSIARR